MPGHRLARRCEEAQWFRVPDSGVIPGLAGVVGIKPTPAELEAAVLSLHQTPKLALPWRFERHPTGSQPACSLPSSIGSMVPNARVDRASRPYEERVFAGRIGLAAALGVEPSCPASKAGVLAGGAATNW